MTHTADQLVFLAAIADQPDDDTARLAYADYLDELPCPTVFCDNCSNPIVDRINELMGDGSEGVLGDGIGPRKTADTIFEEFKVGYHPSEIHALWRIGKSWGDKCNKCHGPKTDDSNKLKAELIRVQCELAPWVGCAGDDLFRKREQVNELLRDQDKWRKGPVCEACKDQNPDWMEGAGKYCGACGNTRDAGGLMRRENHAFGPGAAGLDWLDKVHFRRGFIDGVSAPTFDDCLDCLSHSHRPSLWLRAVLTATPERKLIRRVCPLDKEPWPDNRRSAFIWWNTGGYPEDAKHLIEGPVFDEMWDEYPGRQSSDHIGRWLTWEVREECQEALECAIVSWARKWIERNP